VASTWRGIRDRHPALAETGSHLSDSAPAAIGLGLWAVLVVGTIDNVLRPTLVGRDAQMSDLMIFVSTLGGLAVFGASGLVFGPVIAGVFVTIWQAVSDSSPRPDSDGEHQQATPEDGKPLSPEPPENTVERSSENQSLKLTASKADLDAEVEMLKRALEKTSSSDSNLT